MNISITKTNIDFKNITKSLYLMCKRVFDTLTASIALILLSPIFLLVAILIKRDDKGKVFLTQERIGKNGQNFKLYKFRTMVVNADEILMELLKDPKIEKEYKKNMKLKNDTRITKIGKFLRKTSLDELPQLINVVKGEMSLIGNRPYLPREKDDMVGYYEYIIKCQPGITGPWQVSGRNEIDFENRLKVDYEYYQNEAYKIIDPIMLGISPNLKGDKNKGTKSGKALLKKYGGGGSYTTLFDDNEDD